MRGGFVVVLVFGCSGTSTPRSTPAAEMPLPGETAPSTLDEPNFRVDPEEHPGRLMEDEIDSVIQYAHPEVTDCYKRVLATAPEVEGTAITMFIIGTDGAVTAAASSGIEPRLAHCIDEVIARRVFPPPRGGTVKVRYPFRFKATTSHASHRGAASSETSMPALQSGSPVPATQSVSPSVTCGRRR